MAAEGDVVWISADEAIMRIEERAHNTNGGDYDPVTDAVVVELLRSGQARAGLDAIGQLCLMVDPQYLDRDPPV